MNWIIVTIFVIAFFYFLKIRHYQTKMYAVIILVLLFFFYVSASRLVNQNEIDVGTVEGLAAISRVYMKWLGHTFENTKIVVGNAIKMDWEGNITGT